MILRFLALEQLVEHVCPGFTRLNKNVLVSIESHKLYEININFTNTYFKMSMSAASQASAHASRTAPTHTVAMSAHVVLDTSLFLAVQHPVKASNWLSYTITVHFI